MRKSALAWIGHPLTVLATLVLAVNDHILKPLWPGLLTGKLSDVAGLVVAPPLLNLLLRRPHLSIVLTGAGFALVKSTTAGAAPPDDFFPSKLLPFVLAPLGLAAVIVSGVHARAPWRVWAISLATGALTYFAAMHRSTPGAHAPCWTATPSPSPYSSPSA
ncbi:hypothetical protein GCM10009555_081420 [Acrocarpospora macrocephala]|uniref:Uncharacterized protein n=1 Tax=Acrocarpospora macrocephala TaxID=150177 RepID=A0A5M3WQV1_9ACTN|nr:hypothetical protein [Acrocarpospora macrocephala]GES10970.1 hypothetical protein Amac_045670 [Acrocarpospora macrocephala]